MQKAGIALLVLSIIAAPAFAGQKEKCQKKREKLEQVQSKLRQGYSEPQGNKLRAKRRKLSEYISAKKCRKYTQ